MKEINLNELRDRAYQNAVAHGWHEEERSREHWMCMVITELAEAVQADRKGYRANKEKFEEWENDFFPGEGAENLTFDIYFEEYIKDTVEDEISDAIIRLLDYAGVKGYDSYNHEMYVWHFETFQDYYEGLSFTEMIYRLIYNELGIHPENVIARIAGLAKAYGIPDIFYYVEQKMKYNESRPYKHNKKY